MHPPPSRIARSYLWGLTACVFATLGGCDGDDDDDDVSPPSCPAPDPVPDEVCPQGDGPDTCLKLEFVFPDGTSSLGGLLYSDHNGERRIAYSEGFNLSDSRYWDAANTTLKIHYCTNKKEFIFHPGEVLAPHLNCSTSQTPSLGVLSYVGKTEASKHRLVIARSGEDLLWWVHEELTDCVDGRTCYTLPATPTSADQLVLAQPDPIGGTWCVSAEDPG